MKILLTGFEPFGSYKSNPAKKIAEQLNGKTIHGAKVVGLVLPVDFRKMPGIFTTAIRRESPDVVITLGLAFKNLDRISLETNAHKSLAPRFPDNMGYKPKTPFRVCKKGPKKVNSTLPLRQIQAELRKLGIPSKVSNNAGGHMCEQVLYLGRHTLAQVNPAGISGHIHLPHDHKTAADVKSTEKMQFREILRGVKCAIKTTAEFARTRRE